MAYRLTLILEQDGQAPGYALLRSDDRDTLRREVRESLLGIASTMLGGPTWSPVVCPNGHTPSYPIDAGRSGQRRGVTDAPPSDITDDDRESVVKVIDRQRLTELVLTEPPVKGRKGRPPRTYRVRAEDWSQAYRLGILVVPDIAAHWAKPTPWWSGADKRGEKSAN
jgi:hypothetical protein